MGGSAGTAAAAKQSIRTAMRRGGTKKDDDTGQRRGVGRCRGGIDTGYRLIVVVDGGGGKTIVLKSKTEKK